MAATMPNAAFEAAGPASRAPTLGSLFATEIAGADGDDDVPFVAVVLGVREILGVVLAVPDSLIDGV